MWPILLRLWCLRISAECQRCSVRSLYSEWSKNLCYLALPAHPVISPFSSQLHSRHSARPRRISSCALTAQPLAVDPFALQTTLQPCLLISLFSSTLPYQFQMFQQYKSLASNLLSSVTPSLCLESTLPCNKKASPDKTWASAGITVYVSPLSKRTALSDCCSGSKNSCLIYCQFPSFQQMAGLVSVTLLWL